ncbi:hypothetical protein Ssi03_60950 [Sphaerisporangium siamense]|uniref:non-specific serine/threonine protein kinase n=1 Tax=Sphaerisporangium siamense TaxID=795645 RepID=A0A7W7DCV0_9ACTN|nr:protein kinase [Sphaerisporangium siamense]MBB4703326.1 serine/threonine protein kinase [Sphaerisporangium siamense]GII88105.1 hypothetical protein Ssi03_60950 [Sphaerisporangium siamense]
MTDRPAPPASARLLRNRYRLLLRLGSGGMGDVWLAADQVLGRQVAIKELVVADDGESLSVRRERALREARAAAGVEHPNVVEIYDVFEERGRPWIVMAYVRGRSLRALMDEGKVEERDLAKIGVRVLGALNAAHRADVLHRDVKPANILISEAGRVVLVDFGIAHMSGQSTLTSRNGFIGTVDFMAPERIRGHALGPASDMWSLGVTFYWALEGYSPFGRGDALLTMRAILDEDPPKPVRPGPLADAVARLLDKDPGRRMTGHELNLVLRSVIGGAARSRPRPGGPAVPPAGHAAARPSSPPPSTPPASGPPPSGPPPSGPPSASEPSPSDPPSGRPAAPSPARPVTPPVARQRPSSPAPAAPPVASGAAARYAAMAPETAGGLLAEAEPRFAAGVLLALPGAKAAAVLGAVPPKATAGMLTAMAHSPREAAAVLRLLAPAHAGRAVDYLDRSAAAALTGRLRPGEAARILAHAGPKTGAAVLDALAVNSVLISLVEAMAERSARRAGRVLAYVPPAKVATLLTSLPDELSRTLLDALDPSARERVRRHLGR